MKMIAELKQTTQTIYLFKPHYQPMVDLMIIRLRIWPKKYKTKQGSNKLLILFNTNCGRRECWGRCEWGGLTKGIELSRIRIDVRTMKLSPQKIRCLAPIKTIRAQESKTYAQSLNAFHALPVSPFRGQKVDHVMKFSLKLIR